MKLTVVLSFAIFLQFAYAGAGEAQNINLSSKNKRLEQVLKELRKQTGYGFFYSIQDIKKAQPVTIELRDVPFDMALSQILKNQPLTFSIDSRTVFIKEKKIQQSLTNATVLPGDMPVAPADIVVSGKVMAEDGNTPLAGATIRVKGTGRAVTADNNGHFSIQVPDKVVVLQIFYVGYETSEVTVGKSNTGLQIKLKPKENKTEEVVVIAFGTQKKTALLSSVSTVSNKEIVQAPAANITNALAGRLPGLVAVQASGDPGRDAASLLIRGQSTLNGTSPLVIVDGVERSFSGIDANEVESISILKDASATAVYGIRGANGVILVTTKRGRSGKPVISFTANNSIQQITNYPKYVNAYQYAILKNEGYTNENPVSPKFLYDSTAIYAYRDHTDPYLYPDLDYRSAYMKNSTPMGQYNLNISGGNSLVKYFVSGSFLYQGGLFRSFPNGYFDESLNYTKYNFRSNLDFDLTPQTRLSVNLGIKNDLRKGPYTNQSNGDAITAIYSAIMRVPPNAMPMLNPDGSFSYPSPRVDPDAAGIANNNVYAYLTYSGIKKDYSNLIDASIILTQKLDKILPGLTFSANGSISNAYSQSVGIFRAPLSGGGNPPSNFFARYKIMSKNPDGTYVYSPVIGVDNPVISSAESNALTAKNWYTEGKLTYNGRSGRHSYSALALVNASRNNFIAGTLQNWPASYFGAVGRATYDYDGKYLAEASLGYNGSENFAPGKRMGLFPSYSAGWILSREGFLSGSKLISFLKIRATYGKTGNDQLSGARFLFFDNPYTQTGSYSFGLTNGNTIAGYNEGVQGNYNVTWEVANKYNLGLESRLFGKLLGINVDLFYEKRNKILINLGTVPSIYGQSVPAANLGVVENRGYEIELTHENNIGKFNYYVRANLTYAHNTILFMDEPRQVYPYLARTGQSIGQNWGLQTLGLFRSQADIDAWYAKGYTTTFPDKTANGKLVPGDFIYKDQNGDKVIDVNDMVPIGKPSVPEYNMGLNIGGSYAGFDFSALFQGATSASMYSSMDLSWAFFNAAKANTYIYNNRWTPATAQTATYPRVSSSPATGDYNYVNNDFWFLDASYVRLKQLQVGYTFSHKLLASLHLSSLRVYASGANLFTWSAVTKWNLDPENRDSRAWYYPQQRVFNFGINLTF